MSANPLPSRTLQTNKIINNFPAFLYNLRGNSWCTLELHHLPKHYYGLGGKYPYRLVLCLQLYENCTNYRLYQTKPYPKRWVLKMSKDVLNIRYFLIGVLVKNISTLPFFSIKW